MEARALVARPVLAEKHLDRRVLVRWVFRRVSPRCDGDLLANHPQVGSPGLGRNQPRMPGAEGPTLQEYPNG